MLIDLEQAAAGTCYESQVAIVGAGIAGLMLARKLAERGVRVHLLEAGGLELEERSQSLYAAEMAADRHTGATEGRFRVFGGSSTRWGGQLLPYTDDIFSPPAGCPSAAWPIGAQEIEQYYAEVLATMGVDDLPFTAELLRALGHPAVEFVEDVRLRFSKWAPFARRNLAASVGRACLEHANATVFAHANAMTLEMDAAGERVVAVRVKNYAGAEFRFTAEQFVVACGTIESSRLMLASGVGNAHDQVGRYFHDHVGMHAARIDGTARARMLDRLGPFFVAGTLHTCKLEASAELRAREALPAAMAHVVIVEPEDSGVAAVRNLLRSLQRGDLRTALGENLAPMLQGAADVARLVWESRVRKRRAVSARATVYLNLDLEQVARAENRIRLSDAKDALGQQRAVVDWRVSAEDTATALRFAPHIRSELERLGIAPLEWLPGVFDGGAAPPLVDTFHAMGGLRMGDDPAESVVDARLKVHGVENLYVASCAVYPAGGSSNPTFTLMALALRLGDLLTAG